MQSWDFKKISPYTATGEVIPFALAQAKVIPVGSSISRINPVVDQRLNKTSTTSSQRTHSKHLLRRYFGSPRTGLCIWFVLLYLKQHIYIKYKHIYIYIMFTLTRLRCKDEQLQQRYFDPGVLIAECIVG